MKHNTIAGHLFRSLPLIAMLLGIHIAGAQKATGTYTGLSKNGGYPRVIRLQNQDKLPIPNASANNWLVASAGGIFISEDEGKTWSEPVTITPPGSATTLCCATLYEVPKTVGQLSAGTLLWAATTCTDDQDGLKCAAPKGKPMAIYIYESVDQGRTWTYWGEPVETDPDRTTGGLWEPEFAVDNAGELVMFYSDSSHYTAPTGTSPASGNNQKLMQMRNICGTSTGWVDQKPTVAPKATSPRPGMITVSQMPDKHWFMTYEDCLESPDCTVTYRTSRDGWDYGDPTVMGTQIKTTRGETLHHAPTNTWMASQISPNGSIIVAGQTMADASGNPSLFSGSKLFVNNSRDGSGPWYLIDAPVHIATPNGNYPCNNYSSAILPGRNLRSIFEFAGQYADYTITSAGVKPGPCSTVFNRESWNRLPEDGSTHVLLSQVVASDQLPPDLCLDSTDGSSEDGTPAEIETCDESREQKWVLHARGAGYFSIQNNQTGLCLNDPDGSMSPGTKVNLAEAGSCANNPAGQWLFMDLGNGIYKLQNRASKTLNLTDPGASTTNGTQVIVNTDNGYVQQQWSLH